MEFLNTLSQPIGSILEYINKYFICDIKKPEIEVTNIRNIEGDEL